MLLQCYSSCYPMIPIPLQRTVFNNLPSILTMSLGWDPGYTPTQSDVSTVLTAVLYDQLSVDSIAFQVSQSLTCRGVVFAANVCLDLTLCPGIGTRTICITLLHSASICGVFRQSLRLFRP